MTDFRNVFLGFTIVCAGCTWDHKDDILPTPVVNTPVTPNPLFLNTVARAVKKVEISVEISDPPDCLNTYPVNRVRFQLVELLVGI